MSDAKVLRSEVVQVFADYNQFYVQDGGINPMAPDDWTDQDVESRAKVADYVVVVCPIRNTTVPVEIELFSTAPMVDDVAADHVVECGLSLPTGHLQIFECTGVAVLNWQVEPGTYDVRLLYFGLGTLSHDGLDGADRYLVQVWPGKSRGLSVIRKWRSEP